MGIAGSRIGIVGGSIAGCAGAIALARAGCEVQVFERTRVLLRDHGAGIVFPVGLREELVARGYLPEVYPTCRYRKRWWVLADGTSAGRLVWEHPIEAETNNWTNLWRALRTVVPDASYHAGCSVGSVSQTGDEATIVLSDGSERSFDVIVGAGGYRSMVRGFLYHDAEPELTSYVLWRGDYEEGRVTNRAVLDRADAEEASYTVPFATGHAVIYTIPSAEGRIDPGHRRVNWGIYTPAPPGVDPSDAPSMAPGAAPEEAYAFLEEILDRDFPPELATLVRLSSREEVWVQPIYDKVVDHYADGRIFLLGDAGSVTRPHTGSGATKALKDALALADLTAQHDDWETVIAAYDTDRSRAGRSLAEMGRRIGAAQVESTPDWAAMTPADFETWSEATLSGESLYLLGSTPSTR